MDLDLEKGEFSIERDGQKDLKFKGVKLASVDNQRHDDTRWTEKELYRTDGGKYVYVVVNKTRWQGETDTHEAYVFADADALRSEIADGPEMAGLTRELLTDAALSDDALDGLTEEWID